MRMACKLFDYCWYNVTSSYSPLHWVISIIDGTYIPKDVFTVLMYSFVKTNSKKSEY